MTFKSKVMMWLGAYGAPHDVLEHPLVKQCIKDKDPADTHKYIMKYIGDGVDWKTRQEMHTTKALWELMELAK